MLKILLESFLLEVAQNNLNADKEINYLFETLNNNFLTDLQKEIKLASMDIQELKILAYSIINSEEFKEELTYLNITIDTQTNNIETVYNEVINTLQSNDHNATYNEILTDNNNNYSEAIHELIEVLQNCLEEYKHDLEIYDFYNEQLTKLTATNNN